MSATLSGRDAVLWICVGPNIPCRALVLHSILTRIGIIGISTFYRAYQDLKLIRQDALVTKEEKGLEIINQRTEDCRCRFDLTEQQLKSTAISVKTLGDLLDSPSYDIRQALVHLQIL